MLKELENKLVEIVGKKEDYSLEDVLVVLDKEKDNNFMKIIDAKHILIFGGSTNSNPRKWQLNKPFHLQPQETKDFIGDLLLTK